MKSTRYLNVILTLLTLVLAMNLLQQNNQLPPLVSHVHAQGIPDEGAQRNQIIEQLKELNRRTGELHDLLASGRVSVRVNAPQPAPNK